eukprot:CFRG5410T1
MATPQSGSRVLMRFSEWIGRKLTHSQLRWDRPNGRYEGISVAPRQPAHDPELPGGINHKLSNNPYWKRDTRRAIVPDYVAKSSNLLSAEGEASSVVTGKPPRPGRTVKFRNTTDEYYPDYEFKVATRLEVYGQETK